MEAGWRALDASMRAIDAYKKTFLVDKVTTDDEKSPPVYILDEISSILMSCSLDLTKEIVEYTFRRLRHRSLQVKYKVLRFIKYSVNKAGSSAYRRELQSCSIAIRELSNYQGPVDPLRGITLIQAVRDAADEALRAIFSSDLNVNSKNIRIEGFGNDSFLKPFTTSFRSSGRDSLDHCNGVHSIQHCIDTGSFDSQIGKHDGDMNRESLLYHNGTGSLNFPNYKHGHVIGPKLDGKSPSQSQPNQGENVVSLEDRLVNNATVPNGSQTQPSAKSLQAFLSSAKALDANRIGGALKEKLRSPSWQVRLKAICILKAVLLQKDGHLLQVVEAYEDFEGLLQECLQSPQVSLKGRAKEALVMLSSLKEEKIFGNFSNQVMDNSSCDKPFITTEADNGVDMCRSSLKASPALKPEYQEADLLSFDDPFDGMHVYGSNNRVAAVPVEDLLSDGFIPARTDPVMLNTSLSKVLPVQEWGHKTDMLDLSSLFDFTASMSSVSGKCAVSSLDSKTCQAQANGNMPSLSNLSAGYMHPQGELGGSLHTNSLI